MAPDGPGGVIWMRPEHAATGRPAKRSREEITAAAIAIADQEGLDAVSMRRVAAGLGTGAASLYRYVETREDLLDLMIDATGAEYVFPGPAGDWLADLLAIGDQARAIMRRHPWLPSLLITRSVLGPNGLVLLEHVLAALAPHPAGTAAKLEAFAMLNTVTAGGFFSIGGMTAVDVHGGTVDGPIFADTASSFTIMNADGEERTIDKNSPLVNGWSPLQFAPVSLRGLEVET